MSKYGISYIELPMGEPIWPIVDLTAIGPSEELRTMPMGMFYAVTNANELKLAITENRKSFKAWNDYHG